MFKDLDIYKVILLASILLVPGAWGYASFLDGKYKEAKTRHAAALRAGGVIHEIGRLSAQLESIKRNADRGVDQEPKLFFKNQIQNTDRSGQIKSTSFTVTTDDPSDRLRGRSSGRRSVDVTADIDFVEKDLTLSREYINALLFNCESQGVQIWKLRELSIENEALKGFKPNVIPPQTVENKWRINRLVFARRKPASN
ncbi:MAG: hypothetical protein AAF196_19165 [Planctomycetota bacterium]